MEKGTFFYSVFHEKCPRCQEGELFKHKGWWSLKEIGAMPDRCPVCKQDFKVEDGFFLGATYVSYALALLLVVPVLAVMAIGFRIDLLYILPVLLVLLLCFTPPIMRLSRSIWFNFFVQYDADWKENPGNTDIK